ncbi:GtrA family protein [Aliiruegeria lutimaris]|uniref:Putative flippase GtrA (Transmembrane translocase of bactoprenol-linked glucose) n=1 Tax=Aliiruegeria lutimaris TaxID=571298 RepID=A0A1G8T3E1_9RHOB|nr:GtrA family protein [Aliiruegeria lutimaris]SDJ35983.1 Putative flippase GtrA (transmembrane translocase of bactoprenol-linked glucose) [Aliiruegeria lutimaris]
MTTARLVILYAFFAVIATLANLGVQRVVLLGGKGGLWLMAAIATGTLAGLVIKYILDKRWIFFDQSTGVAVHGRKFSLYTAMGLVTTAIFWGAEATAWAIWQTDLAREIGAVLGLSVGYVVKFKLDRKFVFPDARMKPA